MKIGTSSGWFRFTTTVLVEISGAVAGEEDESSLGKFDAGTRTVAACENVVETATDVAAAARLAGTTFESWEAGIVRGTLSAGPLRKCGRKRRASGEKRARDRVRIRSKRDAIADCGQGGGGGRGSVDKEEGLAPSGGRPHAERGGPGGSGPGEGCITCSQV